MTLRQTLIVSWLGMLAIPGLQADSGSLRERLFSPDAAVEAQALKELDALSPSQRKDMVLDLRAALRVNASSAEKAARALAHLGTGAEEAIPELVEALRFDEESVFAPVGDALFAAGPAAVRPLTRALTDSNFFVRRRATDILGRFGPQARSAAPELVKRLQDPEFEVHAAAEKALGQIGEPAVPALTDALRHAREVDKKTFIDTLSKMGPSAAPPLINSLRKDESTFVRISAAEGLSSIRPAVPAAVPALLDALKDLDDGVRGAAADALGGMGEAAKAALGSLIVVSHEDKEPLVRQKALQALPPIGAGTKDSLPGFIDGLQDPDAEVRGDILAALGASTVPFKDALSLFVSALKDGDPRVRVKVVQSAGALSRQSANGLPIFKLAITDPQPDVRAAAILELGHVKENASDAAGSLTDALKDPNPALRDQIIQALGNLGPAGIPGLIRELQDDYATLSDEASRAIAKAGSDALPALQAARPTADAATGKKIDALIKRIHRRHTS